ncbi:2-phospho-L-lactate guanylyltransferase [Chloroflexota bacterium]
MSFWAIVPVKPLRRGKSRLAKVLTQEERTNLNRHLLIHTLNTLSATPQIDQTLVISRDQAALSLAREYGARTVQENGSPQLNVALERATMVAKNRASRGVLIVPADLPLLACEDISTMIEQSSNPPVVVISPDRHRQGTNALLLCPVGIIEYDFGENSFERHCDLAKSANAKLVICDLPSVALDMDYPEDLELAGDAIEDFFTGFG